jgi:uncharacterized DUF497 family protein
MEFEWDDAKAASNREKHGISFPYATRVFLDPRRVDFDASRAGDGEMRRKTVGRADGRLFAVVYACRGEAIRVISARRTNKAEERAYDDQIPT